MNYDFFTKGTEIIKTAIQFDEARDFSSALPLYIHGIEYWMTGVKYCKNEKAKNMFRQKVLEFLGRAEYLKGEVQKASEKTSVSSSASKGKGKTAAGVGAGTSSSTSEVDAETQRLRDSLAGAILKEKPNITFNDVAGLENAKRSLEEAVILPLKLPNWFKNTRKPWKGILMYGPPGTGKTHLARATANAVNATFFSVSSSDLVSKFVGESEKLIKELFTMAINSKPSIIFIDEIDSIASKRTDDEQDATRRIKNELLTQMTRMADAEGVLVLAATNRPFELDSAVRRRFEKRVYIPLPDANGRLSLFKMQVDGEENSQLSNKDLEKLAKETERYSGADIAILARDALMAPVREAVKATHWKRIPRNASYAVTPCTSNENGAFPASIFDLPPDAIQVPDLTRVHFETALQRTRPTVSQKEIAEHEKFTQMYGENGQNIETEAEEKDEVVVKDEPVGSKTTVLEKKRVERAPKGSKANPVMVM